MLEKFKGRLKDLEKYKADKERHMDIISSYLKCYVNGTKEEF